MSTDHADTDQADQGPAGLGPDKITILFAGRSDTWAEYADPMTRQMDATGLAYRILRPEDLQSGEVSPEEVDYIVTAPNSKVQDFRPYTRAKLVQNLWAGVEGMVGNTTLTQPLARMVESGMEQGMVEWVTAHVLRHHQGIDSDICRTDAVWVPRVPPLAGDRKVVMLGLGELGRACARALAWLGFGIHGWSRTEKQVDGVLCHAGESGLRAALDGAEIAVLLVPLTPETENLMNAERLGWMAPGAVLINPGRGPLVDDDALLAALDSGQLGHATLDVFREEPLPEDHPFWTHPKVTVTPHIASHTRPETATETVVENILRGERCQPFLHLVDRERGY